MKNLLEVGSPNCWESLMFKLCSARNPVTAWTIPARSGHDKVKMYSAPFVATFGIVDVILFCIILVEVALLMLVMMLDWWGNLNVEAVGQRARVDANWGFKVPVRSVLRDVLPSSTLLAVDIRAANVFYGKLSHNIRLCG